MKGKVITIGSSLGVVIPKAFRSELALSAGTPVSIELEDGAVIIRNTESRPTELELTESLKSVIGILQKRDPDDCSKAALQALKSELLNALSCFIEDDEDSNQGGIK